MLNNNIFIVDKPKNISSNQVIQKIKCACKLKKIGHGGTLDPLATGVLIIAINKGTKLLQTQLTANKKYLAKIAFGYQTNTYDTEGEIINVNNDMSFSLDDIYEICNNWALNGYEQQVPLYSAVKYQGKQLYKLARDGKHDIILPIKRVSLNSFKIIDLLNNHLTIEIDVSKGFYVRSFANDLGIKLGGYATMVELRRLKSGDFKIEDAFSVDDLIQKINQLTVL